MDSRQTIAANLRTLIQYAKDHARICADAKALAIKAGLTPSTVTRVLRQEVSPSVETLEAIARAYRLKAWQLLIPNLDPSNPPTVPYTDAERELYWRIKKAAAAYARTGDLDEDDEDASTSAGPDSHSAGRTEAEPKKKSTHPTRKA